MTTALDTDKKNRLLTDEQLKDGVEMFANGKNRTEVAQFFIDTVPDLRALDASEPKELRKRMSNALRVADPNCEQFSEKHRDHLNMHRSAKMESLKERYKSAVLKYAEFLEKQIELGEERLDALGHMLDNAREEEPVGNSDVISTEKARAKLVEQQAKLHKELQETLKTSTA